jgi:cyclophilin family peptidyl-prolyl cis-trans isomerase
MIMQTKPGNKKLWWLSIGFILFLHACSPKAKQWDAPPEMTIDPTKIYLATMKTEKGDIKIELFADKAPITVNNFIFLAEQGYYDDTTFHRVISDFMAQGGDPTGTGTGGPGYQFEDEIVPGLTFDDAGYLAMANSGTDTNGSQFFITYVSTPHLNGYHTIFGKVVEGMDVLTALTPRNPTERPDFEGDSLLTVEIEEIPESILPTPTPTSIPVVPEPESDRPLASLTIAERENLYTGKPAMHIDPARSYRATVQTSQGNFVISLNAEVAPESVNNFVVLAELGYYDGFPIAFVDPDSMVLTGTPSGQFDSDIGYVLPYEVHLQNVRGAVGNWQRQDMTGCSGSIFYVAVQDIPLLDERFSVFGQVVEGMDVVDALTTEDRIDTITIEVD